MADKDELLKHDYDGIQEYDNDLPRWWIAIFIISLFYGGYYVVYYHMGSGLLQEEQLAVDMQELEELKKTALAKNPTASVGEDTLLAMVNDPAVVSAGATLYQAKCLACHGPQGQGLVGPNLTDEHWVHGGSLEDIRNIIVKGVPAKGMLAWEAMLKPEEINALVAFIRSIRGTNPPNPKKPEGDVYQEG